MISNTFLEGMLASADTISIVAKSLQKHNVKTLVIDPVGTAMKK